MKINFLAEAHPTVLWNEQRTYFKCRTLNNLHFWNYYRLKQVKWFWKHGVGKSVCIFNK